MPGPCEYSDVCKRDADGEEDGKCILHSEKPDKGYSRKEAFHEALTEHRDAHGPDFQWMVFPGEIDFRDATFEAKSHFNGAVFKGPALFIDTSFRENASFQRTTFESKALFMDSSFCKEANFWKSTFEKVADFSDSEYEASLGHGRKIETFESADFYGETIFTKATFFGEAKFHKTEIRDADFKRATFEAPADFREVLFEDVSFSRATFEEEAFFDSATLVDSSFSRTVFKKPVYFKRTFCSSEDTEFRKVEFYGCEFRDSAIFTAKGPDSRAFADGKASLRNLELRSEAELRFRYADLSHCRFRRTDLRNVEFIGAKWCEEVSSDGWYFKEWFRRNGLYDEVYEQEQVGSPEETDSKDHEEPNSKPRRWSDIERLYRQLKCNYEERGDFSRAGDFHIGEKVSRRQSPQTHWGVQVLLTTYRALSKYGERALPAAIWLVMLVPAFALLYYMLGASTCLLCETVSYPEALLSSLEATFYPVRPIDFQHFWPQFFSIVQRVISPILIALLALALRQRVKR